MKLKIAISLLVLISMGSWSCQTKSEALEVLEKSIAAQDPDSVWPQLNHRFHMSIKRDGQPDRYFSVLINNAEDQFEYALQRGDSSISQGIREGEYYYALNGEVNLSEEIKEKYQLNEDRTLYMREVYEYLYGVPMKLKDPGTIVDPSLGEESFNGQACWVLRVSYDPETEGETWYFYINKETYLLAGYRFYFDESKNDGEFIFIEGYETINGLKVPKLKKWHWNKDGVYFRTDELL